MLPCDTPHKRESGDERRLTIAKAAREIIVEKGLEGLRTRDIAARVGINVATLHYHVPTKEALITLVAESLRNDFRTQGLARTRNGKTGLEKLRMEFEDTQETAEQTPELIIVLTELTERGRRDPAIGEIITPIYDHWRGQFVEIFAEGVADGSFRPDTDPYGAALVTTGALADRWRTWADLRSSLPAVIAELERAFVLSPQAPRG